MSQQGLGALLTPTSIAIVGASEKPLSSGYRIMQNLRDSGYQGWVHPVNKHYSTILGITSFASLTDLPLAPDLTIFCINSRRILKQLKQLGQLGGRACIILSATPEQFQRLRETAQQYDVRILGPNSLGIIAPWQNLNASFSPIPIRKGKLALIAQSASIANTVLDWAFYRQQGFSWCIALGDSIDIHIDEMLDFLSRDPHTSAILLSLEHIDNARRFVSAARSAARTKPILMIKSGRSLRARALIGADDSLDAAWDAACQRAGILRVNDTHELFSAVETLTHMRTLQGERLFIISNGAALAALALDELEIRQGHLAELEPELMAAIQGYLPAELKVSNPLNLGDDADVIRYCDILNLLLTSNKIDGLMIIHAPGSVSPSTICAEQVIQTLTQHPQGKRFAILTNWCGEHSSRAARRLFNQAAIPSWRTPEGAVRAFMHRVEYQRNQRLLRETPAQAALLSPDRQSARHQLQTFLRAGINQLNTHQVQGLFQSYGLAVPTGWLATSPEQAVSIASEMGYPVAVKLQGVSIPDKSAIQAVKLYLRDPAEVAQATFFMLERAKKVWPRRPNPEVLVQSMARRIGSAELKLKVQNDPLFGPVISFGSTANQQSNQRNLPVALPPLNMALADQFIDKAVSPALLRGDNRAHPIDRKILSQTLVKLSTMIVDCPEIESLLISPLLVDGNDITCLDISLSLRHTHSENEQRLTIRPYPQKLEQLVELGPQLNCLLRPIRPEDEPQLQAFIENVTPEDLYYRYFSDIKSFTHDELANMTQIDYEREMAIVAVIPLQQGYEIIGVARAVADADNIEAEFSVLIRSDCKRQGLGQKLLSKIIDYCRSRGIKRLSGMTMPGNRNMLTLALKLGFKTRLNLEDSIVLLDLSLE